MAQKTIVVYMCDCCGNEIDLDEEHFEFTIDGTSSSAEVILKYGHARKNGRHIDEDTIFCSTVCIRKWFKQITDEVIKLFEEDDAE